MYTSELEAHTWANQGPNGPHEDPMEGTLHKCGTNVMGRSETCPHWLHKSGTTSMTRPLHRSLTQPHRASQGRFQGVGPHSKSATFRDRNVGMLSLGYTRGDC